MADDDTRIDNGRINGVEVNHKIPTQVLTENSPEAEDTADYTLSTEGVTVDMANGAAGGGDALGDTFSGIEIAAIQRPSPTA